jgi:hypothetical protein
VLQKHDANVAACYFYRKKNTTIVVFMRFLGFYLSEWIYVHVRTIAGAFLKSNSTVNQREERVVPTHPNIHARVMFCASLTYQNVTSDRVLAAIDLNTKPLTFRLSAVFRATYSFLMSH